MLATLNLQLSPVEPLADTNLAPGAAAAGGKEQGESGFADLLRSSVDASPLAEETGGELLPEDGSELPGIAELARTGDVPGSRTTPLFDPDLWRPKIDPGLVKLSPTPAAEGELGLQGEAADLMLETPVIYPTGSSEGAANPEALMLSMPLSTATPLSTLATEHAGRPEPGTGGLQNGSIDSRLQLSAGQGGSQAAPVMTPPIDARELFLRNKVGDVVLPGGRLGLRESGQPAKPVIPSAPNSARDATLQMEQRMPLGQLASRLELAALQRADGRGEPTADTLQARIMTPQTSQNLQAGINLQSSQPTLSLAPAGDVSLAGLAQQGTDLISTSVRDSAWGQQIGERVVMMAGNQLKQAEIRLTPAELGPLRVQVSVDDGAAHVTFHAQHAVTREALEQALPRLREMLAENGLSLGQADVSDRGVGEGNRDHESGSGLSNPAAEDSHDAGPDSSQASARPLTTTNGLVDTFA